MGESCKQLQVTKKSKKRSYQGHVGLPEIRTHILSLHSDKMRNNCYKNSAGVE